MEFINQQNNIRKIYYQINDNSQTILSSNNASILQSQINKELLQLKQENDSLQSKFNNLQFCVEQLQSSKDQLQNKYEELQKLYEVLQKENIDLKKQIERQENQKQLHNNDNIQKLQNENQFLKQQNEEKVKQVNRLIKIQLQLHQEKQELEQLLEQLKSFAKNNSEIKIQDLQTQNRNSDENQIQYSQQIPVAQSLQQIKKESFLETPEKLEQQYKQKPKIQEIELKDEYETPCGHKISTQQLQNVIQKANKLKKLPQCIVCYSQIELDEVYKKQDTIEKFQEESSHQKLEDSQQIQKKKRKQD
ncbi:unnamed protein product [Paramecium primaurelia]|uniref:Uncharacterized protein n=1 Tax=Paramecium primaurelia TaxID=5886 RepID=A0A8S1KQL3_PARPR|nr:unnamed protein product [Paramecium primaurelia]